MIKNINYLKHTVSNTAIKAIIASSQIVFIRDGKALVFPDERG